MKYDVFSLGKYIRNLNRHFVTSRARIESIEARQSRLGQWIVVLAICLIAAFLGLAQVIKTGGFP